MFPVSVIIPTYNRVDSLRRTLDSLCRQAPPIGGLEVWVVDDGSQQPPELPAGAYPFALNMLRQANQGATVARNTGALASRGEVLVFVDDDIEMLPGALAALVAACRQAPQVIALASLTLPDEALATAFARSPSSDASPTPVGTGQEWVDFSKCKTGLLAVRRGDFMALGMFQDPGGGWPNWDDVDFGYRAQQAGYRFCRSHAALAQHWDYALADFETAARRWGRASRAAVALFARHPELRGRLPMFADKTPIAWRSDSPRLMLRKALRWLASNRPLTSGLVSATRLLERRYPAPRLLRPLYRWIMGSYMFTGYRQGLKDFA